MANKCYVMLCYVMLCYKGLPPNPSKIRGRVTETSVVDVLINQSTLAIYHNNGKLKFSSNDISHIPVE